MFHEGAALSRLEKGLWRHRLPDESMRMTDDTDPMLSPDADVRDAYKARIHALILEEVQVLRDKREEEARASRENPAVLIGSAGYGNSIGAL